jgi:transposase-like protein
MSALEQAVGGSAIEVVAKATRRRFTVEYKRKIVREADACKTPGAVGVLLRREGLYSSHLTTWRGARGRGDLVGVPKKRGPVRRVTDPRDKKLAEQEREISRWQKRAERAEALVELQNNGGVAGNAADHRSLVMATVTQIGPRWASPPRRHARRRGRRTIDGGGPRGSCRRGAHCPARSARANATPSSPCCMSRFADHAPAEVMPRCSTPGSTSVPNARCITSWPSTRRCGSGAISHPVYAAPELLARRPKRVVELGHHQAAGPGEVDLLKLPAALPNVSHSSVLLLAVKVRVKAPSGA